MKSARDKRVYCHMKRVRLFRTPIVHVVVSVRVWGCTSGIRLTQHHHHSYLIKTTNMHKKNVRITRNHHLADPKRCNSSLAVSVSSTTTLHQYDYVQFESVYIIAINPYICIMEGGNAESSRILGLRLNFSSAQTGRICRKRTRRFFQLALTTSSPIPYPTFLSLISMPCIQYLLSLVL
jgi:hypothetical protein